MTCARLLLSTALLCPILGCGDDGPELATVSGTVTLDQKPVAGADLIFKPQTAGGSPAYGTTDGEGNYTLMFTRDKEGAMLGKHNVEIETHKLSPGDLGDGVPIPEYVPIPRKYKEPGALTAEVKDGDNDIDFVLDSK